MEQIEKKIMIHILIVCFIGNIKGQILEFYEPIVVTYKSELLNTEKIDVGIFDYFKQDTSKMKYEHLKYDSDKEILYRYDEANKIFKTILCLKDQNFKSKEEIKLGIFDGFVLTRESSNSFKATSPYGDGRYPSHHKIIKSIDILQKTKKRLIIRVNYEDEFEWKYFGILVLTDYKYENVEDEE
ncbi:hypothetical protein [Chryseobacterium sp.]|uniref:hypothetical protein n=1 Tax=Chryseobacterium sp. TaxID=1871047 RepID=UPI0011C9BFE2|nr:hypothetical protein [Chryseobacterium sp.]TXF79606.1 hypothetical protein FUA25_04275 [Chryseobacterium sp.]